MLPHKYFIVQLRFVFTVFLRLLRMLRIIPLNVPLDVKQRPSEPSLPAIVLRVSLAASQCPNLQYQPSFKALSSGWRAIGRIADTLFGFIARNLKEKIRLIKPIQLICPF